MYNLLFNYYMLFDEVSNLYKCSVTVIIYMRPTGGYLYI